MYAAAGGASLASRQKRKNQAALNVKNKALLQQGLKDKLAASRASSLATPTKAQSRQFHNLPSTYLRTPQAQVRKLGAGYTTQSRILLPINESNNHLDTGHGHHSSSHTHSQSHQHYQQHNHHLHESLSHSAHPNDRSHSPRPGSHPHSTHPHHKRLTKSATTSIPFASQYEFSPPNTPICLFKHHYLPMHSHHIDDDHNQQQKTQQSPTAAVTHTTIQLPCDDIIVTPATPLPSPGPPTADQLERKCSFYRGKKLLAYEESLKNTNETTTIPVNDELQLHYTDDYHNIPDMNHTGYLANGGREKWTDSDYCDSEHRQIGVCTCDHIEVICMRQFDIHFKLKEKLTFCSQLMCAFQN